MFNEILINHIPILQNLEYREFVFKPDIHISLAAAIVSSNLTYKSGIYIVYNFTNNNLSGLLYLGKAGSDNNGKINTHQIPKRLLAVCYPTEKYLSKIDSKNPNRNKAWPIMMEIDGITAIKICCFYSVINKNLNVENETNPLILERKVNDVFKDLGIFQQWSKKKK